MIGEINSNRELLRISLFGKQLSIPISIQYHINCRFEENNSSLSTALPRNFFNEFLELAVLKKLCYWHRNRRNPKQNLIYSSQ